MEKKKDNKIIKVDNDFTTLAFRYTQEEMDILFYVISLVKSDQMNYSFHISDIEKASGREFNRTRFRNSVIRLGNRVLENFKSADEWEVYWLFSGIKFEKGVVQVLMNPKIMPFLCSLKKNYTSLELSSSLRLGGKHSKRLYLLLSRWKNTGGKIFEIDELKKIMGFSSDDKEKNQNSFIFRRQIERSLEDLNKNSELKIEPQWIKSRNKFTHIQFKITKNRKTLDPVDIKADLELVQMRRALSVFDISDEVIERLHSEGCTMKDVNKAKEKANQAIAHGTVVNNPGSYLIECFKSMGFLSDDSSRKEKIAIYRKMLENGIPLEPFAAMMKKERITMKDVTEAFK